MNIYPRRTDRRFRPLERMGWDNSGLEPRFMASSASIHLLQPLSGSLSDILNPRLPMLLGIQPNTPGVLDSGQVTLVARPASVSAANFMHPISVDPGMPQGVQPDIGGD